MNTCRTIDLSEWARRDHYDFFKDYEHPHFDLTMLVEVTQSVIHCRQTRMSFFKLTLHMIMKAANAIPEFRIRMRNGEVVEYEAVDAAPTYVPKNRPGLYANMLVEYDPVFRMFSSRYDAVLAEEEKHPSMTGAGDRPDVIYLSCIPWIAFTSLTNPIRNVKTDSVPRISWGKYTMQEGALKMPVTVQLHHSLADAYHVAQFLERFQESLNAPEKYVA